MLITGNYRCFDGKKTYSIMKAVNNKKSLSNKIYNSVLNSLILAGAERKHFIPFYLYLKASKNLNYISSIAKNIKKK